MKIGFTTRDSVHINAHFGSASQIDVYDVNARGFTFLEKLRFQGNLQEDGNEDKLAPKVRALHDCTIVYVGAIGGSAAGRLIGKNITPIKADSETTEIKGVLAELVKTLNSSPPPWLRKALSKLRSDQAERPLKGSSLEDNRFEDDSFDVEIIEEEIAV